MSPDPQDESEELDSDKLGDEYPPEEPLGVDEYGITAAEERIDEPLEERVARERSDTLVPESDDVPLLAESDSVTDQELIGADVTPDPHAVELDEPDPFERTGDGSVSAEESAVRRER